MAISKPWISDCPNNISNWWKLFFPSKTVNENFAIECVCVCVFFLPTLFGVVIVQLRELLWILIESFIVPCNVVLWKREKNILQFVKLNCTIKRRRKKIGKIELLAFYREHEKFFETFVVETVFGLSPKSRYYLRLTERLEWNFHHFGPRKFVSKKLEAAIFFGL